jgi:hypothetical protein
MAQKSVAVPDFCGKRAQAKLGIQNDCRKHRYRRQVKFSRPVPQRFRALPGWLQAGVVLLLLLQNAANDAYLRRTFLSSYLVAGIVVSVVDRLTTFWPIGKTE